MKSIYIIGPSGSGKSTLSKYLSQLYKQIFGHNSVLLINLDPANPQSQYQHNYDIDINNLVTIQDIMQQYQIGPNGAMLYAIQFLQENKQWLVQSIKKKLIQKQPYFRVRFFKEQKLNKNNNQSQTQIKYQNLNPITLIFDLPGQIQLYLNNDSLKNIISQICRNYTSNQLILQLFDSTYIYNINDFVSLCMMSLVSMINFQMPNINLLNKIDVIKGKRPQLGMLNEYLDLGSVKTMVEDLEFFHIHFNNKEQQCKKQKSSILNALSQILDQYNQVSFLPCSIYKQDLIKYLIFQIQITFGYHEILKNTNNKYSNFIKNVDKTMKKQQLITQLENQFFQQEQNQEQQQIIKIMKEIQKDKGQKNK